MSWCIYQRKRPKICLHKRFSITCRSRGRRDHLTNDPIKKCALTSIWLPDKHDLGIQAFQYLGLHVLPIYDFHEVLHHINIGWQVSQDSDANITYRTRSLDGTNNTVKNILLQLFLLVA